MYTISNLIYDSILVGLVSAPYLFNSAKWRHAQTQWELLCVDVFIHEIKVKFQYECVYVAPITDLRALLRHYKDLGE